MFKWTEPSPELRETWHWSHTVSSGNQTITLLTINSWLQHASLYSTPFGERCWIPRNLKFEAIFSFMLIWFLADIKTTEHFYQEWGWYLSQLKSKLNNNRKTSFVLSRAWDKEKYLEVSKLRPLVSASELAYFNQGSDALLQPWPH